MTESGGESAAARHERTPAVRQPSSENAQPTPALPPIPSAPGARFALSSEHLLALHRVAGNTAVGRLIGVQRQVVDDADAKKVLLKNGMTSEEMATVVQGYLRASKFELEKGVTPTDEDLFDAAMTALMIPGSAALQSIRVTKPITMSQFGQVVRTTLATPAAKQLLKQAMAARKGPELEQVQQTLETTRTQVETNKQAAVAQAATGAEKPAQSEAPNLLPLQSHAEALQEQRLRHFAAFDKLFNASMLWRFTSTPGSEFIKIEAGVGNDEILKVVANHSGGNDKSNPRVITLSFGRNIAALVGIAASAGGDKQVLGISSLAPYLYGIDISTLHAKGIEAHPARARSISLFETEYVLVPVPGAPQVGLNDLATVKYNNPFRGMGAELLKETGTQTTRTFYAAALEKLNQRQIVPDVVQAQDMTAETRDKLLKYAKSVAKAAQPFAANVMLKEAFPPERYDAVLDMIDRFVMALEKLENQT